MYCHQGLRMTPTSTAHTLSSSTPWLIAAQPASNLHMLEPGQSLWLYLDCGSTLYCQAGQVRIHSQWHYDLVLCAEDAPYNNGAHTGWHQVESLSQQPATLCATQPRSGLWQNTWRAIGEWLGCTPNNA